MRPLAVNGPLMVVAGAKLEMGLIIVLMVLTILALMVLMMPLTVRVNRSNYE